VDAMHITHYLGRTMTRRLLAFLALLTGLAAMGAPVQAAFDGTTRIGVEQRADQDDAKDAQSPCSEKQRKQKSRTDKLSPCKEQQPVTIYIPTVMFGADRAYE